MDNIHFWMKKLDPYFEMLDEIPLFRGENFSFEDLASFLKKELNLQNLSISCNVLGWHKQEEIKKMLGGSVNQLCLSFPPLMGNVYIWINDLDVKNLTSILISDRGKTNFSSTVLEDGFYRFLILLILDHLKKTATFQGLSPKIIEHAEMKALDGFFLDLSIQGDSFLHAIIAITSDFRRSWNEFFSSKKSIVSSKIKSNIEVPIQLVAGVTFLTRSQWKKVKEGDFIVLDRSYIDLDTESNKVIISLNDNPIFLAKLTKSKIHILDYAKAYEEHEYMEPKINKNKESSEEELENQENFLDLSPEELLLETNAQPLEEEISSFKDIPIKLTVEIAKLSLSLEKLMELQPGNFLKLPISLDNPVNLTVNGKKIGTAELTKLGETVGIRILQIS